ncbi:kinesin-like protein KIF27 [Agrilus planipennis]|nr:kinesin-like protein KIF27 [Agrilus planipennis]
MDTKTLTPQTKTNQEKLKTAEKSKIFEIEGNPSSLRKHVNKSKQKEICTKHSNQIDSVKRSDNLDDTNKELITSQDLCLTKYESLSSSCKSQSEYSTNSNLDNLRHEIRNLRRTRDYLVERLCNIDTKMNKRILSEDEERKLLQYEEAIGAIDFAIEYKNQIMCGCATLTSKPSPKYEEYAEKMMIERLLKLNDNEMRSLLHQYFEKVVDLRFSSKKLEVQLNEMEAQNDSLTCRVQNLTQTLQQVRQQHEDKLHLMMRHFTNEDGNERKFSRLFERSKQAALALQVAQGPGKQIDKGIIARFTRYARQETVPRQLQVVNTQPQAKVTRQKNKLIIQQNNK